MSRHQYFSTFVSKHYTVDPVEFKRLIDAMGSEVRQAGNNKDVVEVKVCKLCVKGNKTKADNIWKLRVRKDGSYHCFRCALSGNWFDLKRRASGVIESGMSIVASEGNSIIAGFSRNKEGHQKLEPLTYEKLTFLERRSNHRDAEIRNYLSNVRQLSIDICVKYGVGYSDIKYKDDKEVWQDELCITFPWMVKKSDLRLIQTVDDMYTSHDYSVDRDEKKTECESVNKFGNDIIVKRLKHRSISTKGKQRLYPKGGLWGLFGYHTIRKSTTEVLITEGEFDTLAVAEALNFLSSSDDSFEEKMYQIKVISLPNGCNSLPPTILPLLERFKKIYLWFDDDAPGHSAIEKFSQKLGIYRCVVVRPLSSDSNPPKDANDALKRKDIRLQGEILKEMYMGNREVDVLTDRELAILYIITLIKESKPIPYSKIQTFFDLRSEVLSLMYPKEEQRVEGTPVKSIPTLNKITKGFRKGELVVFTGPTGSGKTTILSQISLDFAKENVPTLWGSFEIKNTRLLLKMLHQYQKKGLNISKVGADVLADDFESLPLYFLNFHGSTALNQVLEALDVAVYNYDVQHIIIDNLQFMMPINRGFEKFDILDEAITQFRRFSTEKNVNVILVIHPKKEDDKIALGISSIFGSAKATQESDMVLILQKLEDITFLDVKKNRFDGNTGKIYLEFSPVISGFFETEKPSSSHSKNTGIRY